MKLPSLALLICLACLAGSSPAFAAPFPSPTAIGPAVRFSRVADDKAYYSILVGVQAPSSYQAEQCVNLRVQGTSRVQRQVLDRYGGYTFLRWKLEVPMGSSERSIVYSVTSSCAYVKLGSNAAAQYHFFVPGKWQSWRWAYYSCNGHPKPSDIPPGGVEPLWADLMKQHVARSLHLVAGNGDQIYNDGVLASHPDVSAAANGNDTDLTLAFRWKPDSIRAVNNWFFSHYAWHWSLYSNSYRKALAFIPFTMMLDDHDLLNGFGSQPPNILNSDLLRGIARYGRRFYLLFQQHSTESNLMDDLRWNGQGPALHILSRLGPGTAFLAPDERFERTRDQVMSDASYNRIQRQLDSLPGAVRHLVVLSAQPLSFPVTVRLEDKTLEPLANKFGIDLTWSAVQDFLETKLGKLIMLPLMKADFPMQFGTLDLSDVLDQWCSVQHQDERARFVQMLQKWAMARKARITFLSGDAHIAFANEFASMGSHDPRTDPRYSLSLTSSAIGNNAWKGGAVLLEATGDEAWDQLDQSTTITQLAPFEDVRGLPLGSKYSGAARNWLYISEAASGDLLLTLRFEAYQYRPQKTLVPVTTTFVSPLLQA